MIHKKIPSGFLERKPGLLDQRGVKMPERKAETAQPRRPWLIFQGKPVGSSLVLPGAISAQEEFRFRDNPLRFLGNPRFWGRGDK